MSWMMLAFVMAPGAAEAASAPLATYRGGEVTAAEYADWLASQDLKDAPAERRGYLESLALAETLEAAALSARLDHDPAVRFRLDEAERRVLVQAFQRREGQAIRITDAEVEATLEAEKAELVRPRRVRLRNIFKRVAPGAAPAEREAGRSRMEELRRRLLEGADFAELALRESDSQTRFQGGVMGAVPSGALHPEVERVAFGLGQGELSTVIETADGFTLLRCEGIVEGRVLSLDEARKTIRDGLWRRRSEARQESLRAELLSEAALQESTQPAPGEDAVVARFRGGQVTRAELGWLAGPGPASLPPERWRPLLEGHVVRVLTAERARRRALDSDPAVRAHLLWARSRTLATAEMARRVAEALVRPTAAEIQARFEANRAEYQRPPQMDFSVIRLPMEAGAARRRLREAQELLGRLESGREDFADAARALSRHASSAREGRLGWLTARQAAHLGPNVLRALSSAEPGQVVGPVQQDDALWILKLWGRRPARSLTFEEARERVERELGDARVSELQQRLEREARSALQLRVAEPAAP